MSGEQKHFLSKTINNWNVETEQEIVLEKYENGLRSSILVVTNKMLIG